MRRFSAALLGLLALLAAGCGSGGDTAASLLPHDVVRAAPQRAESAGTVRFEAQVSISGFTIPGFSDMVMDMEGQSDYDAGTTYASVDMYGMESETITDGTTVYMRSAMFGFLGVDGWIRMDLGEFPGMDDVAASSGFGGTYDATQYLGYLSSIDADVEVAGTEDVRGVATTHYRATTTLGDNLDTVYNDLSSLTTFDHGFLEDLAGTVINLDVWLDDDGLPRRVEVAYEMDMSGLDVEGVDTMTTAVWMEFFDYGAPVSIAIPGDDETTDFFDIMEDMGVDPELVLGSGD